MAGSKSFKVSFNLDESDIAYFKSLYNQAKKQASKEDRDGIIRASKKLIKTVRSSPKTPGFVEEAIQSLVEGERLEGARGVYRLVGALETVSIPDRVQAILAARIDRLSEREKHVLQTAAVIGKRFSPKLLEKGYEASMTQLEKWVNDGVSADELIAKKSTITGTFKVGLATTRGMANQILTNAERGRSNSHLDDFPGIINALTLEQVNEAIKRYVNLEKIVFVAAGSVDDGGNPLEK